MGISRACFGIAGGKLTMVS